MKSLSKTSKEDEKEGDYILTYTAAFFSVMFMIALTITCFLAPVWDAFDNWMEKDIRHSIYVFLGFTVTIAVGLIWIRFRKK